MDGKSITTAAGLAAKDGTLHPVRQAIVDESALQCGFCTPGIAVTGAALLAAGITDPDEQARRLAGNLCRCTGYAKVMTALAAAGKERARSR